jgi:hypothetical protein
MDQIDIFDRTGISDTGETILEQYRTRCPPPLGLLDIVDGTVENGGALRFEKR